MTMDRDGAILTDVVLTNTYSYNNGIATSASGNWIATFELGGPDGTAYAVLGNDGQLVSQPIPWTNHEPTRMGAVAFPDGSFGAIMYDDESLVAVQQIVDNEGRRVSEPVIFSGANGPGYNAPYLEALSNNETLMITEPYDSDDGILFTKTARGHLELRVESPTEARLYNWSANTVDVVLSAD